MRPEKLIMTAFGPYAEETQVDFRKLNQGVYLITGDTGAGKTTIFDALVFALYGEGSGNSRNSDMFHSDYVDKFIDTKVVLEFSAGNKSYRITRTIHYKKKRGDGGVGGISKQAVLECIGEYVVEKETNVNGKVTEILGLDEKQFRQIVMLAQGEFRKFLESKSDAREQILGKLFDNRIYVDFQNRLKEAAEELRKEREALEAEAKHYLSGYDNLDDLKESCKLLSEKKLLSEAAISLGNEKLEKNQEALRIFQMHNQRILELRQLDLQLSKAGEEIEQKQEALVDLKNICLEKEKLRPLIQELLIKIQALEQCRADYTLLAQKTEILRKYKNKIYHLTEDINHFLQQSADAQKQIQLLEEKLDALDTAEAELACTEHELSEQKNRNEKLRHLLEKRQQYAKKYTELEEKQRTYLSFKEIAVQSRAEYEHLYDLFLDGQAGVLADKLKKEIAVMGDAKCPVCKSLVDRRQIPEFENMQENIPTQEEVRNKEKKLNEDRKKRDCCAKECEGLKGELTGDKEYLSNLLKEIFGENCSWEMLKDSNALKSRKAAEEKRTIELTQKLKICRENCDRKVHCRKELKKGQDTRNLLEERIKEYTEQRMTAEQTFAVTASEMKNIKEKLFYENPEEAEYELKNLMAEKNRMEKEISTAEQQREQIQKELSYLQGQHKKMRESQSELKVKITNAVNSEVCLHGNVSDMIDTENMETEISEIKEELSGLKKERESLLIEADRAEKNLMQIKGIDKKLDKSRDAFEKLWKLAAIANGQSRDGGKYSFSRYVLGTYFEEIISFANYHLDKMTGGKYELIRQQEADRKNESAGLGMVIYDAYTGEKRETGSLSGGESFQVSLSLALGLSDAVRSRSAGYTLDTMFIDEGFGSLDEQSLEKAMEVLHELSGDSRQIGIISHVAKLSENIPQKICVKRSDRGSSIEIINGFSQ